MPNKMERFTNHSRWILSLSQEVTEEFEAYMITPAHMLLGMTRATDTDARDILAEFDIIASKLAPFVKAKQAPAQPDNAPEIELSDDIKRTLEMSVDTARRRNDHFIGTPHLLIGLLRSKIESIDTILHHFDVEEKAIIKFAESYMDEDNAPERAIPEQGLRPLYPAPHPSNLLDSFRRIWHNISKQKDDNR